MISETVVLDVRSEPMTSSDDVFTHTIELVTADFLMCNLGTVTETMDVRFPMAWPTQSGRAPDDVIQNVQTFVDGWQVANHTDLYGHSHLQRLRRLLRRRPLSDTVCAAAGPSQFLSFCSLSRGDAPQLTVSKRRKDDGKLADVLRFTSLM